MAVKNVIKRILSQKKKKKDEISGKNQDKRLLLNICRKQILRLSVSD